VTKTAWGLIEKTIKNNKKGRRREKRGKGKKNYQPIRKKIKKSGKREIVVWITLAGSGTP